MIKECYEDLQRIFNDFITETLRMLDVALDSNDIDQYLADIQQAFLDMGTELENAFNLYDTPVIASLQECCELLYQYSICNREQTVLDKLKLSINSLSSSLESSVAIKDVIQVGNDGMQETVAVADDKEAKLAVVAIIRDNAKDVKEWIEYHRLVGVEHFYIYDNESTDNLKEVLMGYIEAGIVTYAEWPGTEVQLSAYNDAINKYKNNARYMAFIDDDEFIVPVCGNGKLLPELIDDIMARYERRIFKLPGKCGGVGVNWRVYGTSNHKTRPDGLIIENYRYRASDDNDFNVHIKTICNPKVVNGFLGNSHSVSYKENYHCISENGSYILGPFFHDGKCEHIRINHYQSKSEEEFLSKLNRGWPDQPHKRLPDDEVAFRVRYVTVDCNEVYDYVMERYVARLRDVRHY